MSKFAPLPGSEAALNPAVVGQRGLGGRMQPALFHARERRLERFVKAGAGHPDPGLLTPPGIAIPAPVTVAQGLLPVTLVWSFEFASPNLAEFLTSAGGIDGGTEVITTAAPHGFVTGDAAIYNAQGGVEDVGLVDGTRYWVNVIAGSTLSLHTSQADALSDTARVDLTVSGAETHSLDKVINHVYPAGTLLDTGETVVAMTALGVLSVNAPSVPTNTISVDVSDPTIPGGGVIALGRHTIAVFLDPPNNRSGLFLDGDQIGEATGALVDWADGVATWEYMNTVADADAISDLEIFVDFIPPTFVG